LGKASHTSEAARELQRHFQRARQRTEGGAVTVIFLDECDALLSVEPVAAMLAWLLDEMMMMMRRDHYHNASISTTSTTRTTTSTSWSRVMLVAATNRLDSIPAALRRPGRFDREIPLAPPTATERFGILKSLLSQSSSGQQPGSAEETLDRLPWCNRDEELRELADLCVGYVAADLAALVRRAALLRLADAAVANAVTNNPNNAETSIPSYSTYLKRAMEDVGASALRDAALSAPPTTTWDDIAGDAGGAKRALRQAMEWPRTKSRAYQALGLTPPRGILLHGPPGCSKTTLARAAAGATAVAFVSLSPADVYASSYVGEAEAVIRRAFDLARAAAPCVLFFDEIDAILGSHESDNDAGGGGGGHHGMSRGHSAEARVLSTFLNEMDGVDGSWSDGVLVLGATNRPWTLDAALLRPGRFDKIIYVPPPDFEARRSLLHKQTKHWNISIQDPIDVDYLASESVTGNMTGAEIQGACQEAAMKALCRHIQQQQQQPNESHGRQGDNTTPVAVLPEMTQSCLLQVLQKVQPMLSNPNMLREFRVFEERNVGATGGV